ncbi:MAG: hypothetical protein DI539_08645 [Flavobacterium psychrophilum]|nr:MAG: hypothetical protein DI539_08645 [Flavobacterium psychrophilum]
MKGRFSSIVKKNNDSVIPFYSAKYDFSIDPERVMLVQKGNYHSLSFPVTRSQASDKLENLFLHPYNGGYLPYLLKYNFDAKDWQDFAAGITIDDLVTKMEIFLIEDFDISGLGFEIKTFGGGYTPIYLLINGICHRVETGTDENGAITYGYVPCPRCECPQSNSSGSNGSGGTVGTSPVYYAILDLGSSIGGSNNGGGAGTIEGPGNDPGDGSGTIWNPGPPSNPGNGSNTPGFGNPQNGNPVIGVVGPQVTTNEEAFEGTLDDDQEAYWDDSENELAVEVIKGYLEENYYSTESKESAIDMINRQLSINENDYPGKEDNFPYEWWKDDNFIEDVLDQGPYDTWGRLSEKEKQLIKGFPREAHIIYKNKAVAEQATNNRFGNVPQLLNGKPDAFRHAFFNAINTVKLRKYYTEIFATAHESEVSQFFIKEKQMDLHNNEVGMDFIEFDHPNMTNTTEINNGIYQLLINGELVYLSPINYNDPAFSLNHGITTSTTIKPTDQ